MTKSCSRWLASSLAVWTVAVVPQLAHAQAVNPYFRTGGNIVTTQVTPAVPFSRSFQPTPYANPGFIPGYNPFMNTFMPNPLSGAADVINAQGQYLQARQGALLQRQQVKQAEIDTRRKLFDQRMYELANTPTSNQIREQTRQQELQRAMSDPPQTEISSGTSLNTLLTNIQLISPSGLPGPMVPVNDQVISRINVSSPNSSGTPNSTAMLRQSGKINWPFALTDSSFAASRNKIEPAFAKAVESFNMGMIDAGLIRQLNTDVDAMQARLRSMAAEIDGPDFIEARKFLNQLSSSVTALRDPSLLPAVVAASKVKGSNVFEVVNFMTQNGLKFAPALPGDEGAYFAMHHALVSYNVLLMNELQARAPAPKDGN